MSLTQMLNEAAGGRLFAAVAQALTLDESATRSAMMALCPAIAEALHARAAQDDELFQSLLDLIEDGGEAASLAAPQSLTSAEAIADGNQILSDVYGSRAKAAAALRTAGGRLAEGDLDRLAPVCATTVVAALAQANQPLALAAAAAPQQAASGSGGILATLISAIIAGIVAALTKQLSLRRRRSTGYSTARTRRRTAARGRSTATRRRTASASLENVFRDILSNLGK